MMEKKAYGMATLGLDSKDGLQPKRNCDFCMRYFFLFVSLIEFLIILGLVLFMMYSNPLEGTEKHLKGLKNELEQSDKKIKAFNEEVGKLKRQLNATEKEARLIQTQMLRLNTTFRLCNSEKTKLKEQQLSNAAALSTANENKFNLRFLNITCIAKVTSLEKQLVALDLNSQMERSKLSQESKSWQVKAENAEKEKNECQIDKLELQTREHKYQELKSTLVQELDPVLKNIKANVEQFLRSPDSRTCYPHVIENTFHSLFGNMQTQIDRVAQQFDRKASEVTQENALLQSQKTACKQHLQERDQQMSLQKQQFEWEKKVLQDNQENQIQKIRAECSKMLDENEGLKLQLQQTKQACIGLRTSPPGNTALRNPFSLGTVPRNVGNTGGLVNPPASSNAFSNPILWGRPSSPVQPSSGSQRNLSTAEQNKVQEMLKSAAESGKLPVNPAGQPKS